MPPLDSLTDKQRLIYDFVRERIKSRGYGPTVREIGDHFQIKSPNGVMCHLRALEKKGIIERAPNKSRAIQVSEVPEEELGLPLIGQIAAGVLHEGIEQGERLNLADMFSGSELCVFRVAGESMIEAQIADGDYVVANRKRSPSKGDIVIAETDEGEATLKKWFPESNRIRLQPANKKMAPIYVRNAKVLGVVVGVIRKLGR